MPCDINELSNIDAYESTLLEVSTLCITHKVQYMCLLCDMNADFSSRNYWFTNALNRTLNMKICILHEIIHVLMFPILIVIHIIIYFPLLIIKLPRRICVIGTSTLASHYVVKYYSVCDELDNQSDHAPLVMTTIFLTLLIKA